MAKYCALLVAPNGDYVTDYHADTKEEVIEKLANRGSEWFFYPFEFVTTEKLGRIVSAPPGLSMFERKSVKTVIRAFKEASKEAEDIDDLVEEAIKRTRESRKS